MMRVQKAEMKKKYNIVSKKLEKMRDSPTRSSAYGRETVANLRTKVSKLDQEKKKLRSNVQDLEH